MLRGTGKLKFAGAVLLGSSLFMLAYMLYAAIMISTHKNAFDSLGNSAAAAMVFIVGYHLYKLIISILAIKRAKEPKPKGVAGNTIALLVLSIIWLMIVGLAFGNGGAVMLLVFLMLAILDLVMLILMLVGVIQNNPSPGPMPLTPFNYDRLWNGQQYGYGQPNGYGQPDPYGQANPYAQPGQFGQPSPYGQPMPNAEQGVQFGAQNTQFGAAPEAQAVQGDAAAQNVQNAQGSEQQDGEKPRKVYCNQDRFVDPRMTSYGQYFVGNGGYGQYGQYGYGGQGMPQMPYNNMQGGQQPMQPQMPPMPPMNDTRL